MAKSFADKWGDMVVSPTTIKPTTKSYQTGSYSLDAASGSNGFLAYQINRLAGAESTGKSSICYNIAKQALNQGESVLWLDFENSFRPEQLGNVNQEKMLIAKYIRDAKRPLTLESATELCSDFMLDATNGGVIVFDSVDASITDKRHDADIQDSLIASIAKVLTNWLPYLSSELIINGFTAFFVSQARANIGDAAKFFPIHYSGGHQLKHFARQTLVLEDRKNYTLGSGDTAETVGRIIRGTWRKNNASGWMASSEFPLRQGFGIDWPAELLDFAVEKKTITRSGAWYKYGEQSWLGLEGFRQAVLGNIELVRQIEADLTNE